MKEAPPDLCEGCGMPTTAKTDGRVGIDVAIAEPLMPTPPMPPWMSDLDLELDPGPRYERRRRVWCPNCRHLAPPLARPM